MSDIDTGNPGAWWRPFEGEYDYELAEGAQSDSAHLMLAVTGDVSFLSDVRVAGPYTAGTPVLTLPAECSPAHDMMLPVVADLGAQAGSTVTGTVDVTVPGYEGEVSFTIPEQQVAGTGTVAGTTGEVSFTVPAQTLTDDIEIAGYKADIPVTVPGQTITAQASVAGHDGTISLTVAGYKHTETVEVSGQTAQVPVTVEPVEVTLTEPAFDGAQLLADYEQQPFMGFSIAPFHKDAVEHVVTVPGQTVTAHANIAGQEVSVPISIPEQAFSLPFSVPAQQAPVSMADIQVSVPVNVPAQTVAIELTVAETPVTAPFTIPMANVDVNSTVPERDVTAPFTVPPQTVSGEVTMTTPAAEQVQVVPLHIYSDGTVALTRNAENLILYLNGWTFNINSNFYA